MDVDLALWARAFIVRDVDGSGKVNECIVERPAALANTDVILNVPKLGIHFLQLVRQLCELR